MAPAADTNGNIYIMTGNGTFDGTNNFGESMVKLNGNFSVLDYATPTNWRRLTGDTDFGAGGPVLLPTHYVVGMGKDGIMYLADVNNMGHVGNFSRVFRPVSGRHGGKSPVYWQGPGQQYLFAMHVQAGPNRLNLPAQTSLPPRSAPRLSRRTIAAAAFPCQPMERTTAFCGKLAMTATCGHMTR